MPIAAKLMADLITTAGANRVLTIDLHAPQIQGFFNIPVDHIYSAPVWLNYFRDRTRDNLAVVAPDVGSIKMVRAFRQAARRQLGDHRQAPPAPERGRGDELPSAHVKGKEVVIFDDMIDTAGTLAERGAGLP